MKRLLDDYKEHLLSIYEADELVEILEISAEDILDYFDHLVKKHYDENEEY